MTNSNGYNPPPGHGQSPGYGGYPQAHQGQAPPGASPYPMSGGPSSGGRPGYPPIPRSGGSSRALPVIAGVGLAVGVCLGLLMVRGTGKSDAATPGKTAAAAIDAGVVATVTEDAGPSPAVAADAAVEVAVAIDAAPPQPAVRTVVVELDVLPQGAAVTANGDAVTGERYELELPEGDRKKVTFRATAQGYITKSMSKTITDDMTVKIRLPKRRSGGGNSSNRRRDNDGLIDL